METYTGLICHLLLRLCVLLIASNKYVLAQLNLPIFDFLYQHTNHFNESIRDTNLFFKEYDFIVIGSGSGGSVVANRLTEIGGFTVLLLEAGGEENAISDLPLTPSVTQLTSNYYFCKKFLHPLAKISISNSCMHLLRYIVRPDSVVVRA